MKRVRLDVSGAFIRPARLICEGRGLICAGRLWKDVTDKVLRRFERRAERKENRRG
jgi:hypothetical protein